MWVGQSWDVCEVNDVNELKSVTFIKKLQEETGVLYGLFFIQRAAEG